MRSPGDVVPGSRDPGSGGLHRLPGGAVWRVTCAHTQAFWRRQQQPQRLTPVSGVRSDRRGSRPSRVRLGGALNPLSLPAAKQRGKKKSLASSAAADFFPDSLPASCGALTPSGCVHAASPSPFPAIRPKPSLSSQPRTPRRVSRQASRAGERCSASSLSAGVSPFFPLRPCCCGIRADSCGSRPSLEFI